MQKTTEPSNCFNQCLLDMNQSHMQQIEAINQNYQIHMLQDYNPKVYRLQIYMIWKNTKQ